MKHNGIISLWKFLFAIVIVFFHTEMFYPGYNNVFFRGGYIAVEFFFIVSGFYFAKSILSEEKTNNNNLGEETVKFLLYKIKSIIPYLCIIFIISTIILVLNTPSIKIKDIINSTWELLLLKGLGFRSTTRVGQWWYLSALFVSMGIFYPIIRKYKENFILCWSPLIVLLSLGYLCHNWLGLNHAYGIWDKFCYTGIIRAIAEMNIGFIIFMINKKFKNINYTKLGKGLLTILGESLLMIVLFIISFISFPKHYDYIMLLLIAIAITIFVSEKTYEYEILSNKFFYYLERISLPIYINHMTIIYFVRYYKPFSNMFCMTQSVISVIISIIFSIIEFEIIKKLKKKQTLEKLKKIFIKNEISS